LLLSPWQRYDGTMDTILELALVRGYGGRVIRGVVIGDEPGIVVITSEDEFARASREGQEPTAIGVKADAVTARLPYSAPPLARS
jgi:hypothetical protein